MQELIWKIRPDLIIKTGIAQGGPQIFSVSMLALLNMCEALKSGTVLDPQNQSAKCWNWILIFVSTNESRLRCIPCPHASRSFRAQA